MTDMALEQPGAIPELEQWWPRSVAHLGPQFIRTDPRSSSFMAHLHVHREYGAFVEALDGCLHGTRADR